MAARILRTFIEGVHQHGSGGYKRGCRCVICRAAKSEEQARYRERLRGRVGHTFVLAADARNLADAPDEIKRAHFDRLAMFGRELDTLMRKRSA